MLVRQAGEHLTESLQPYVRYATRHDPSDESWPTLTSLNLSRPANIQRINDTVAYFGNPEVPHRTHHTRTARGTIMTTALTRDYVCCCATRC